MYSVYVSYENEHVFALKISQGVSKVFAVRMNDTYIRYYWYWYGLAEIQF